MHDAPLKFSSPVPQRNIRKLASSKGKHSVRRAARFDIKKIFLLAVLFGSTSGLAQQLLWSADLRTGDLSQYLEGGQGSALENGEQPDPLGCQGPGDPWPCCTGHRQGDCTYTCNTDTSHTRVRTTMTVVSADGEGIPPCPKCVGGYVIKAEHHGWCPAGAGKCPVGDSNNGCTARHVPWPCCTGPKMGRCVGNGTEHAAASRLFRYVEDTNAKYFANGLHRSFWVYFPRNYQFTHQHNPGRFWNFWQMKDTAFTNSIRVIDPTWSMNVANRIQGRASPMYLQLDFDGRGSTAAIANNGITRSRGVVTVQLKPETMPLVTVGQNVGIQNTTGCSLSADGVFVVLTNSGIRGGTITYRQPGPDEVCGGSQATEGYQFPGPYENSTHVGTRFFRPLQANLNLPVGRWFNIDVYFKQWPQAVRPYAGELQIRQDGVLLFDAGGPNDNGCGLGQGNCPVWTKYGDHTGPNHGKRVNGGNGSSVNIYTDGAVPDPMVVYYGYEEYLEPLLAGPVAVLPEGATQ